MFISSVSRCKWSPANKMHVWNMYTAAPGTKRLAIRNFPAVKVGDVTADVTHAVYFHNCFWFFFSLKFQIVQLYLDYQTMKIMLYN